MQLPLPIRSLADDEVFDLVVIGAGGAGMSAAVYGAAEGARVLLIESTDKLGGTTAFSAGTTWIPGTHLAPGVNPDDNLDNAARFLDAAVGDLSDRSLRGAFLANGAAAVARIEAVSHLKYRARPVHPDYLSELPGSTVCGRALEPLPFDGRQLGPLFDLVRPPIPEFTVLAGMMVDRDDIGHLLQWNRKLASLSYSTRIILRHLLDRVAHPRGTRLLMGNALIGRLLLSLKELQVAVMTRTQVTALGQGPSGVDSVSFEQDGQCRTVRTRGGVILATGGFNRHPTLRAQRLPGVDDTWCPGAPGHTGRLHDLVAPLGAHYGTTGQSDCFWAPVSLRKRVDGSTAAFPHFVFDRAKPHMLTVDSSGQRFLNESTSYHLFGQAMQRAHQQRPAIPAYLITDANGLQKYGLGQVRPGGMGLASALEDGYVTRGHSLPDLAKKLGLPADALVATVQRYNSHASTGTDPDFNRGSTTYQRANGDINWPGPNPSLGTVDAAPFYAVKLYPGDIGAATGLAADAQARVLDSQGQPIGGLYACGNDMHSVMGGVYPGPGITIGPGLVFAYLAARHAAARAHTAPQPA